MKYELLHQLTPLGLQAFEKVLLGQLPDSELDLSSLGLVVPVPGTSEFEVKNFATAKELANAVLKSIHPSSPYDLLSNIGLWAWLTYVLRDQLFDVDNEGRRLVREFPRWFPADPNDWQKAQRHLVRMPVLLLASLKENADHLLCGPLPTLPEIREQLTSQQDMFNPTFQRVARALYFDDKRGALKRGAGGKTGGTPRRLAKVRKQLDVTWELDELEFERVIETLPAEFDKFKPKAVPAASG
jgi:hypothetical protein